MKSFITLILVLLLTTLAHAQESKTSNMVYDWDGVTCEVLKGNKLMLCRTDYPLMTERLVTYGNIKKTKNGAGREFDFSEEKKITVAGRELYKSIMAIVIGRLFAVYQAPISYNSITIMPYDQVPWDESLLEPIRKAFEKAKKLDAADQ